MCISHETTNNIIFKTILANLQHGYSAASVKDKGQGETTREQSAVYMENIAAGK